MPGQVESLQTVERLRAVPLFAHLDATSLQELSESLYPRRLRAGQTVFLEGYPGGEMYFVVSGHIRICRETTGGREITLARFGPGGFFGDMALLDGQPRSASAYAEGATDCLVLCRDDLARFLERWPSCALAMLAFLSQRLRDANQRIETLSVLTVRQRLAARLADLAEGEGELQAEGGWLLGKAINHRVLGDWLGTTRETVSRMASELSAAGLVSRVGRRILVLNIEGLRDLAREA